MLRVLSYGSVSRVFEFGRFPRPPSRRKIIDDHLRATAVWHVAASEFVILAVMRFLVAAKRGAVWHDCHDPLSVMTVVA